MTDHRQQATIEPSSRMIKRLLKMSVYSSLILMVLIFIFTKYFFYSIIFLLGAIISISGFLLMIKMIDRILKKGKGQWLFFLVLFAQLIVITLAFYVVSRVAKGAVLVHILGLSIIVLAIFMEGIYQFSRKRSVSNG